MATAALDPTQQDQTTMIPSEPTQASPVAGPSQAAGASAAPTGADGIQAGYAPPADPSITGQPTSGTPTSTQTVAGTGAKMLHGILSALGGSQDTVYSTTPDGKLVASTIPSGPGMQFKRIIAGAVAGLAAGAGQTGPGHLGRALAAGTGAGMQQAQEQTAQAKQQAEQDYNNQQKSLVQKAQMAALTQQTAASTWELSRKKIEAGQVDTDHQAARAAVIKDAGGFMVGHAPDFDTFMKMHAQDPSIVQDHAQGLIVAIPHPNGDGTFDGVDIYRQPDDPNNKPLEKEAPIQREVAAKTPGADGPDGQPTWKTEMIPAGSMSLGAYSRATAAVTNRQLDLAKQAAATADQKSQIKLRDAQAGEAAGKNATELQKAKIEAGATVEAAREKSAAVGGDQPTIEEAGQQLAANRQAVSQITTRGGLRQAAINRADQILMQTTGQHFSPEGNEIGYKQRVAAEKEFGPSGDSGKTIASFDALLGHAQEASTLINGARQGNVPWLNTPMNKIKVGAGMSGSETFKAYQASLQPVRDEVTNLLNNQHAAHEGDKEAMRTILSDDATPAQQQAALKQIVGHTATVRLRSMNFAYKRVTGEDVPNLVSSEGVTALQHFGIDPSSVYGSQTTQAVRQGSNFGGGGGTSSAAVGQAQPTPNTHVFNAAAWAANPVNKGKDVNAAIAQAKRQGYTVQ